MKTDNGNEWKRPGTIIAIIALIVSSSVAGIVIWQALHSPLPQTPSQITQTITVSKGRITLIGNGSSTFINFTVPGNLISAFLNVSFTGVEQTSATRLSLLNQSQYQRFKTCNCIYAGNYSTVSTTWSSPMSAQYSAQIEVPYSGTWTIAFQHEPGNGTTENIDETIFLTYTLKG